MCVIGLALSKVIDFEDRLLTLERISMNIHHEGLKPALSMESAFIETMNNFLEADALMMNENLLLSDEYEAHKLVDDVHVDVILLGFPASFVGTVRDKWFASLTREDATTVTLEQSGTKLVFQGGGARYHFHVLDVAPETSEAVCASMQGLLRPTSQGSYKSGGGGGTAKHYINAWEMDILLSSLAHAGFSVRILGFP